MKIIHRIQYSTKRSDVILLTNAKGLVQKAGIHDVLDWTLNIMIYQLICIYINYAFVR